MKAVTSVKMSLTSKYADLFFTIFDYNRLFYLCIINYITPQVRVNRIRSENERHS